jgi:hypothetical protein
MQPFLVNLSWLKQAVAILAPYISTQEILHFYMKTAQVPEAINTSCTCLHGSCQL